MFPSRRRSGLSPTLHKLFWELIPFLMWLMVLQVLLGGIKIQWITACHVCNSQGRSGFRHVYSELGDRVPVSVSESSWKSDSLCCNARTGNIARFCNRGWLEIIPLYNEAQRPLPPLRARGLASGSLAAGQAEVLPSEGRVCVPSQAALTHSAGHTSPSRGNLARKPDFMTSSLWVLPTPQPFPGLLFSTWLQWWYSLCTLIRI